MKLTIEAVKHIRRVANTPAKSKYQTPKTDRREYGRKELAELYGVSESTITKVVRRDIWIKV